MAEMAPIKHAGTNMVLVSAVALIDRDGRLLLAKRPEGKPMADYGNFLAARSNRVRRRKRP